nr:MAG TPA: hypothetical protein [Caudoviricetes sp.]
MQRERTIRLTEFFDIVSNSTEAENLGQEIFIKIWWIKKLSIPLWCGRETKPTSLFDILDDTIREATERSR